MQPPLHPARRRRSGEQHIARRPPERSLRSRLLHACAQAWQALCGWMAAWGSGQQQQQAEGAGPAADTWWEREVPMGRVALAVLLANFAWSVALHLAGSAWPERQAGTGALGTLAAGMQALRSAAVAVNRQAALQGTTPPRAAVHTAAAFTAKVASVGLVYAWVWQTLLNCWQVRQAGGQAEVQPSPAAALPRVRGAPVQSPLLSMWPAGS